MTKKFFHFALRISHALTFGLFALIFVINFSVTNAAPVQLPNNPVTSKQVSSVSDGCGLLSAADINSISQKIQRVEAAHKIKIAISFVPSTNGQDIIDASDNMRNKLPSAPNGKIVLLVSMDSHRYEMATDTVMMDKITQSDGIPYLKRQIKSALHDGDYSGACNNFVDGVDVLVAYYETNGKAYVDEESEDEDFALKAGIAIILSLIAFYFIRSHLIASMSNIHHAAKATDYLEKNSVKLTDTRDMFLFSHVSRSKKSSNSRGGSGGHSGGGGGGGSF